MFGKDSRPRISADAGGESRVGVKPETIKILYDEIVRDYKRYDFDVSIQRDGTPANPAHGRGIVTFADKDRIVIKYGEGASNEIGGLKNSPLTHLEIHSKRILKEKRGR